MATKLRQRSLLLIAAALGLGAPASLSAAPTQEWTWSGSAALRVGYDSNLFLQAEGPSAVAGLPPSPPSETGAVMLSALVDLRARWSPTPGFSLDGSWSADATTYADHDEESYLSQKFAGAAKWTSGATRVETTAEVSWVDGDDDALTFTRLGGGPCNGGLAVRSRRDQVSVRSAVRAVHALGDWRVRGIGQVYYHDFQTLHRSAPGYVNYTDRSEWLAGADIGRQLSPTATVFAGWRHGRFWQPVILGAGARYAGRIDRFVIAFEGQPAPWLKVVAEAGPDLRHFDDKARSGFDRSQTTAWVDLSAVATLGTDDSIAFSWKQFLQPSSGGRSMGEDVTLDLFWKHRVNSALSSTIGVRTWQCDFDPWSAGQRDDRTTTPSVKVDWTIRKGTTASLSAAYDVARSDISATPGREFDRLLTSLTVRQDF